MPDVVILAAVRAAKNDPNYAAAKGGDAVQAAVLVENLVGAEQMEAIRTLLRGRRPTLSPVHAIEMTGVNEIPMALAVVIAHRLDLEIETSVIQENTAGHTGASGWHRLAHPAIFSGQVTPGGEYLVVDDFIGQGGTIANLCGFIQSNGGRVLGATTLTGQAYSARLAPDHALIEGLRAKHGQDLEEWWKERFGYAFDCLTHSEARYLERAENADSIRERLLEAGQSEVVPDASGKTEGDIA